MNKLILVFSMQVLSILPMVFFLLVYTEGFAYIGMALILLGLLVVNIYNIIKKMSIFHYPV